MSDKLDLAAIKARHAATTPGEWRAGWMRGVPAILTNWAGEIPIGVCFEVEANDAEWFTCAHNHDIPALLAEVRRLQKGLTEISENGASLPSEANADYASSVLDGSG